MSGWKAKVKVAAALALILTGSMLATGKADAAVSHEGEAFKPTPISQAVYQIPPQPEEATLTGARGNLAVEYWRPKWNGHFLTSRTPVAVFLSVDSVTQRLLIPAANQAGVPVSARFPELRDHLVPRGYTVVYAAQTGTGKSGGCFDDWSDVTADDGSLIVQWAGTQGWSTGKVGMYGLSNGASNAWLTALSRHRERTKYLKAIVPMSGIVSMYDAVHSDGAPNPARNMIDGFGGVFFGVAPPMNPAYAGDRACTTAQLTESVQENSGDFTEFWQAREHRDGLGNLRAATLMTQGFFDPNVNSRSYMGLLDRWPGDVPLKILLGIYGHSSAKEAESNPGGGRKDWLDMVTAWYDRWLKGLETNVEDWPTVQVQDATGQWRQEADWIGRQRKGALALSQAQSPPASSIPGNAVRGGMLGATRPDGQTTYLQGQATGSRGTVSFTTPPMPDNLRIYGDPILDVSLKVSDPMAKVGVRLDVVDPQGEVKGHPYASTHGARSMRHLEDLVDGRFAQIKGVDPELNKPFRTTIRLNPTDMLVPKGWHLRVSFFSVTDTNPRAGGPVIPWLETTSVEGSAGRITILHDCDHPTVLRFAMAHKNSPLLNVWDSEESYGTMTSTSTELNSSVDGGGLATQKIC